MNAFDFPPDFRTAGHRDQRHHDPRALRRHRPRRRSCSRLWRDRRHVGADGGRSCARPHRRGAGPARHGTVRQARRRLRQEDAGRRHRGRARCAEDRPGRPRHARYRQHGRLCVRRAISGPRHAVRADRRAAARHRPVGGDPQEPAALALPLRRAGHGDGWWPAASASISTGSGTSSRQPGALQRSGARALCEALRAAGRHAFRFRAVRRVRPGCDRQPGVPGQGQARHAGARHRRRKVLRRDHGKDHAVCRQQRARRRHPGLRPLDHGGKPDRDDRVVRIFLETIECRARRARQGT